MEKLINYLKEQKIRFEQVDGFIKISGKTFKLIYPNKDGLLFGEKFQLLATSDGGDNFIFNFGGKYYYSPQNLINNPQLNELKYLGEVNEDIPTTTFLGVRGAFELLNGAGVYKNWVKKAKFLGVKNLGICEKNTLAGALKFQIECKANGIKPIIGATFRVHKSDGDYKYDVKCYVKDERGWQNILSIGKVINIDSSGVIDEREFFKYLKGLVVVLDPKSIDFDNCFPYDFTQDYYYQLDTAEFTDVQKETWYLNNLKKFFHSDFKPISITDAFYLDKDYSYIKQKLNIIGGAHEAVSNNQYFKSKEDYFIELQELFNEDDFDLLASTYSKAVDNEDKLAYRCKFEINTTERHLPKYFMTPEEAKVYKTNEDLFWGLIEEGLTKKVSPDKFNLYLERVQKEYNVISMGKVLDYFLMTRDITNWAQKNGILTGIARGSGGGSMLSYLLSITQIDPIKYDLLFERFLNEGRIKVSLPDLDLDFPTSARETIKNYMEGRFGETQVCSVGTYTSLKLRGAIKDLTRLESGVEFKEVNDVTSFIGEQDKTLIDLFKIASKNKTVKNFIHKYPNVINDLSIILGQPKAKSVHACAMMIFPKENDMYHWVPMKLQDGNVISEWEGNELDSAGFLKEDILGILQLDKFSDILKLIKQNTTKNIDIYSIPIDDKQVYKYFKNGWNGDVFHFGSPGLTGYCKELKPDDIEELIAAIALYRPGAMENNFHNEFVLRKDGKREVEYFTGTENILDKTRGVFVYQEQIMKLCQVLGGLSLVEADDVRKAMVKKKYEALHQYRDRFIDFYHNNFPVDKEYAVSVWDAIDRASTYLFNRCISGDERIKSLGVPYKYTIGELWKLRNVKGFYKTLGLANDNYQNGEYGYSLSLCEDNKLRKNKIKDIRFVGFKPIYRMELMNGSHIDVTNNHKFPTNNGEKKLEDLFIGEDKIYVNLGYFQEDTDYRFTDKGKNNPLYNKNSIQENFKLNSVKGVEGFIKKGGTGFKKFDFYRKNLKKQNCEICGCEYKRLEVHHRNGVTSMNDPENLMTVCPSCHKKEHYKLGRNKIGEKGLHTDLVDIDKIYFLKEGEVYDVEMENPNHTFTTGNDIVTSNSHAAAYTITGYISQWLKMYYPTEYWTVALSYAPEDKVAEYISEINRAGKIKVLPPDINISEVGSKTDFKTQTIYWGLSSIKMVGETSTDQIISDRNKDGEYFSLSEFTDRHTFVGSKTNKRVVENLILTGAFDTIEGIKEPKDRLTLIKAFRAQKGIKIDDSDILGINKSKLSYNWWWNLQQKQLSGIAFFDFNLLYSNYFDVNLGYPYKDYIEFSEERSSNDRMKSCIAGYVVDVDVRSSTKGNFARITLENNYDFCMILVWADQFEHLEEILSGAKHSLMLINGVVSYDNYKKSNVLQTNDETTVIILS